MFPALTTSARVWLVLAGLVVARVVADWPLADNHICLLACKVASIRLRLDAPASAYFLNPQTSLRIDLLFDYPVPAATLVDRATRTRVRSYVFHVASERDLLHLKKIARAQRSAPGDAEDIAFLEARRTRSK